MLRTNTFLKIALVSLLIAPPQLPPLVDAGLGVTAASAQIYVDNTDQLKMHSYA